MCGWCAKNEGVSETYKIMCERIKLSVENKSYGSEMMQGTLPWRSKIHINIKCRLELRNSPTIWMLPTSKCTEIVSSFSGISSTFSLEILFFQLIVHYNITIWWYNSIWNMSNKFTWIYVGEIRPSTSKTSMILFTISMYHYFTRNEYQQATHLRDTVCKISEWHIHWRQKRFIAIVCGKPKSRMALIRFANYLHS